MCEVYYNLEACLEVFPQFKHVIYILAVAKKSYTLTKHKAKI